MCAWTAPADFSVSEVVTAAKLNSNLRDNMLYLKGSAGEVAIDSSMLIARAQTLLLTLNNTGGLFKSYFGGLGAGGAIWDINRNPTTSTFDDGAYSHARISLIGGTGTGSTSYIAFNTSPTNNTLAVERLRIDGSGNVGIGVTVPQGRLHTYNTISGCLKFEADAVAGSLIPVIPDGAGDVVYGIMGLYAVRSSGGTTRGGNFTGAAATLLAPSANADLYNVGGTDVLQLQVAANGSVGVIRTAGSLTYKVSLWLNWL